jgi:hypothetical protein
VQPFYRRIGKGARSWARPSQGRCGQDKTTSRDRQGRGVGLLQPRGVFELDRIGYGARQIAGSRPGPWPVAARWGLCLGAAHRRRDAPPCGGASLPPGPE